SDRRLLFGEHGLELRLRAGSPAERVERLREEQLLARPQRADLVLQAVQSLHGLGVIASRPWDRGLEAQELVARLRRDRERAVDRGDGGREVAAAQLGHRQHALAFPVVRAAEVLAERLGGLVEAT